MLGKQRTGQLPLPVVLATVNHWRTRQARRRPQPRLRPKKSILWKRKLQMLLIRRRLRMQLRQRPRSKLYHPQRCQEWSEQLTDHGAPQRCLK